MLRLDPLIQFLFIGGLLFAGLTWLDRSEPGLSSDRIVIGADQVNELARSAELLQGRAPTRSELEQLVAAAIREEVYYRSALALELDVDDDEVRRRLVEKMQYLSENLVDPEPPEADLEAYFAANAERFRIPELVTFEQVFFSPRSRGETVRRDAMAALASLRDDANPSEFGDSTPLDGRFEAADADRVRILFGDSLTDAVFSEPLDIWLGPFESDFGLHLVRITERSPARDPGYAEVEPRVREAYALDRRREANAEAFAEMRANFDIAVQWSGDSEPEAWP